MIPHKSDSTEQKKAEKHLLSSLQDSLGATFVEDASLPIKLGVKPDGIDPKRKIVVEVFAHLGKLKAAQARKAKADVLKLAYIRKMLGPEWKVVICFASNEAASFLQGHTWAAEAAREFGVEVVVQDLSEEHRQSVLSAQKRQRMVNPQ